MDNNSAKALKSGVWYFISNFTVRALAFLTTPIFTRILSQAEYGEYNNFVSWANIALIVVTMRMDASLISARFDYKDQFHRYNFSIISLSSVLTLIWTILITAFSSFFCGWTGLEKTYLYFILIYCFSTSVINTFQGCERYLYQYKRSVLVAIFVALSSTLVSLLLVFTLNDRLAGRVIGTAIPPLFATIPIVLYFLNKGKQIDIKTWPYALKICLPFVPHLLSLTVLNSVDRIMIRRICGPMDTALYSVAYACGNMVTLFMTSMNSAFGPWQAERIHNNELDRLSKVSKYYIIGFCALAICVMFLAPEALLILGGKEYLPAMYVMPPVAMGCVCQFLYTLFVNIEQQRKKTVGMAVASAIAAVANYLLNLVFIPKYGYIAAAYTTLAGFLILLIIHMYLVKTIGLKKAYSYRFIISTVAVMMIITLLVNFTYASTVIRLVSFAIFLITLSCFIFWKRELVFSILRLLKRN